MLSFPPGVYSGLHPHAHIGSETRTHSCTALCAHMLTHSHPIPNMLIPMTRSPPHPLILTHTQHLTYSHGRTRVSPTLTHPSLILTAQSLVPLCSVADGRPPPTPASGSPEDDGRILHPGLVPGLAQLSPPARVWVRGSHQHLGGLGEGFCAQGNSLIGFHTGWPGAAGPP